MGVSAAAPTQSGQKENAPSYRGANSVRRIRGARRGREQMKRKPKSPKYRNLFARGGVIYYQRRANGRRIKLSTKTAD